MCVCVCDPIWHVSSRSGVAHRVAMLHRELLYLCTLLLLYFTTRHAMQALIKLPDMWRTELEIECNTKKTLRRCGHSSQLCVHLLVCRWS